MNPPRAPADLTARRASEALRWWVEAGVDIALDETPHDRFAESAAAAARSPKAAPAVPRTSAPPSRTTPAAPALISPPDQAARSAAEAARAAPSLDALRAALEAFEGC